MANFSNSFSGLYKNRLTRKFAGVYGGAEPYVTGYHGIWFENLPKGIKDTMTQSLSAGATLPCGELTTAQMQSLLASACTSVTPPGGTLSTIEMPGLGGTKWGVPGNVDYGTTVSLKFFELQGRPISTIFHYWFKMIRDYRSGVTDLTGPVDYNKTGYSAMLYYWTTSPDGKSIQYYAAYDGVYPHKDPQDLFSSDIETIGKLDIEIEFHLDYAWHEPWVANKCQTFCNAAMDSLPIVNKYDQAS